MPQNSPYVRDFNYGVKPTQLGHEKLTTLKSEHKKLVPHVLQLTEKPFLREAEDDMSQTVTTCSALW